METLTPEEQKINIDLTHARIAKIHADLNNALRASHENEPREVHKRIALLHEFNQKVLLLVTHS